MRLLAQQPDNLQKLARRRHLRKFSGANGHNGGNGNSQELARRWRADGNYSTLTWITLMAATLVYIGKSVDVGSGSRPL
jgi:hypothetical protein